MAKKGIIPLAIVGGGLAFFAGGKKTSKKKKKSKQQTAKEHTFFKTNARHLMISKGCKEWVIGSTLTHTAFSNGLPSTDMQKEELMLFVVEDVAPALDKSYQDGMDPVQLTMATIERLAPTCTFRIDAAAPITDGQASLFAIVLSMAGGIMVKRGLIEAESGAQTLEAYKDRLPPHALEAAEKFQL